MYSYIVSDFKFCCKLKTRNSCGGYFGAYILFSLTADGLKTKLNPKSMLIRKWHLYYTY